MFWYGYIEKWTLLIRFNKMSKNLVMINVGVETMCPRQLCRRGHIS